MRLVFTALFVLSLVSCSRSGGQFKRVSIQDIYTDSVSIRGIAVVDTGKVWFAANYGRVGLIDNGTPKLATIKYQDSLLNFRSIAIAGNSVFVLSIANPAVLYRIGYDGKEATFIEEVYIEKGPEVFYDSMAFWNSRDGIAMGDPVDGCLSVILTSDGGTTWQKLGCDRLPPVYEGEAAFAASNSNIAVQGEEAWLVTGGKYARVFYTPDKGETWEVNNTPIIQGRAMTGIYSVDFYDTERGIVFGGDWDQKSFNEGNKAITANGGATWKLVSNGSGPGYRSAVRFVPGTQGRGVVAVGSEGISYSPDFGESWKQLSDEGFYTLEFVNDTLAFAAGKGRISRLRFK